LFENSTDRFRLKSPVAIAEKTTTHNKNENVLRQPRLNVASTADVMITQHEAAQ